MIGPFAFVYWLSAVVEVQVCICIHNWVWLCLSICVSVWRAINHVTNVSILRVLVWTLENIKRKRFEEILSSLCIEVKNQARFHIHADITLPPHKFKVLNLLSYWFHTHDTSSKCKFYSFLLFQIQIHLLISFLYAYLFVKEQRVSFL